MPTIEELKILQSLPLELKVLKTKERIKEFVEMVGEENCYVSFSGGKDSTTLLHLVREMYPNIEGVFCDTGLEYPEIRNFVKTFDNITWLKPEMTFRDVITKYGYPFISKEVAECVYNAKIYLASIEEGGKAKYQAHYEKITGTRKPSVNEYPKRVQKVLGVIKGKDNERLSLYNCDKYKDLLNVDFNITHKCCFVMKKQLVHKYAREKHKVPFIATMTEESRNRQNAWVKTGCNSFDSKNTMSKPMSFWTEQDVLKYIKENDLPIAQVYGDIIETGEDSNQLCLEGCGTKLRCLGCQRTGCIFCGFGAHLDTNGGGRADL